MTSSCLLPSPRLVVTAVLLLGVLVSAEARRPASFLLDSSPSTQRDLLKETNNEIEHGPRYGSRKKQQQEGKYHIWANKMKGTVGAKKPKHGHQLANTRYDQDDIALQRLDSWTQPSARRKTVPKSLNQIAKKKVHKPSKKMDKMYKKMLEKERLTLKKQNYKKLQRKVSNP